MFTLLQRFHNELEEFAAAGVGHKSSAVPSSLQISFCNFVCNRLPDANLDSKDMVNSSVVEYEIPEPFFSTPKTALPYSRQT